MPEIKEELKEERRKEIEKIVDNEVKKQKGQLTDNQKNAIAALVDADVAASGGVNKEALLNTGKYVAVAAASAAAGAFAMYAVKKWGPKRRPEALSHNLADGGEGGASIVAGGNDPTDSNP